MLSPSKNTILIAEPMHKLKPCMVVDERGHKYMLLKRKIMTDCWMMAFEQALRDIHQAAQYGDLTLADFNSFEKLLVDMPCSLDKPQEFAAWKMKNLPKLQATAGEQVWTIVVKADDAYMLANKMKNLPKLQATASEQVWAMIVEANDVG